MVSSSPATHPLPHPAREMRLLRRHGVGEVEGKLGANFYFFSSADLFFELREALGT